LIFLICFEEVTYVATNIEKPPSVLSRWENIFYPMHSC